MRGKTLLSVYLTYPNLTNLFAAIFSMPKPCGKPPGPTRGLTLCSSSDIVCQFQRIDLPQSHFQQKSYCPKKVRGSWYMNNLFAIYVRKISIEPERPVTITKTIYTLLYVYINVLSYQILTLLYINPLITKK